MTDLRTEDEAIAGSLGVQPGAGMPRRLDLIGDPSVRPDVRSEPGPRFPFPIPNGWFIVAASGDVATGAVQPLHYFGRDLVLFRTQSGVTRVTSAYCAHLGAHLGVGGTVRGEVLQCPFHGWCYDGESGKCADIPYGSGKIPTKAAVRAYPTLERNGMVWAWHHLEGKPPFYDVPEVPELSDPEWSDPYTAAFTIRTCCQEMAENNHDAVHFQFVHGTPAIPEQEMFIDGCYKRATSMDGFFVARDLRPRAGGPAHDEHHDVPHVDHADRRGTGPRPLDLHRAGERGPRRGPEDRGIVPGRPEPGRPDLGEQALRRTARAHEGRADHPRPPRLVHAVLFGPRGRHRLNRPQRR